MGEYEEDGDFAGLLLSDSDDDTASDDGRTDLLNLEDLTLSQVIPASCPAPCPLTHASSPVQGGVRGAELPGSDLLHEMLPPDIAMEDLEYEPLDDEGAAIERSEAKRTEAAENRKKLQVGSPDQLLILQPHPLVLLGGTGHLLFSRSL